MVQCLIASSPVPFRDSVCVCFSVGVSVLLYCAEAQRSVGSITGPQALLCLSQSTKLQWPTEKSRRRGAQTHRDMGLDPEHKSVWAWTINSLSISARSSWSPRLFHFPNDEMTKNFQWLILNMTRGHYVEGVAPSK